MTAKKMLPPVPALQTTAKGETKRSPLVYPIRGICQEQSRPLICPACKSIDVKPNGICTWCGYSKQNVSNILRRGLAMAALSTRKEEISNEIPT